MSKKHKKEKKEAKKFNFPETVMVRMDYNPEWDEGPMFDTVEMDVLTDGDRVATYKLVTVSKVKNITTLETE